MDWIIIATGITFSILITTINVLLTKKKVQWLFWSFILPLGLISPFALYYIIKGFGETKETMGELYGLYSTIAFTIVAIFFLINFFVQSGKLITLLFEIFSANGT